MIYVARQLGHGAELTMRTYGHATEAASAGCPQLPAEDAISAPRRAFEPPNDVPVRRLAVKLQRGGLESANLQTRKRPDQDSNLGPTP